MMDEGPFPLASSWQLPNGFGSQYVSDDAIVPIPFEVATSQIDFFPLGGGAALFELRSRAFTPLTVKVHPRVEGPILVLRQTLRGRTGIQSSDAAPLREETPRSYSLTMMSDQNFLIHHRTEDAYNALTLYLSVDRLRQMMAGNQMPTPLRRFLDGDDHNFAATVAATAAMRRVAEEISAKPYTGAMASLYTQGKVCEMLIEVLRDLSGSEEDAKQVLSPDRRKAMAVRDRLMADLAKPVSVELLAREVGLSERRLNEVFRDSFGMTVFEWMVDQRLTFASDLLRQGGVSIKEIAFRLGYARVNTFTGAFVRRFGTPPSTYRIDIA